MKKLLILFLLILIKPINAGPKVELVDSIQKKNEFLKKYLLSGNYYLDYKAVYDCKVLEPLKIEKLEISYEEATEKLNLSELCIWSEFRHKAASLINSGANPNININHYSEEHPLLNVAVIHQDYFFVHFLLNKGASCNKDTLRHATSLMMTKLLISYGANPRETQWREFPLGWEDPLFNTIFHAYDLKLLPFYISQYNYSPNKSYNGNNLLHYQLNKVDILDAVKCLLAIGTNPFKKNNLDKIPMDMAKEYLESHYDHIKKRGQEFLEVAEEYALIFRETLIDQTKEILPLELQDYIYKFHAGEDAELFAPKD